MNCPHCNTEIDEHEVSRCLDAWVADVVMGEIAFQPGKYATHNYGDKWFLEAEYPNFPGAPMPHYSTDIAAAWIIWNHCINQLFSERDHFFAVLEDDLTERNKEHERGWRIAWPHAMMNLSPLAICRAALKAVAVIQERKVMA